MCRGKSPRSPDKQQDLKLEETLKSFSFCPGWSNMDCVCLSSKQPQTTRQDVKEGRQGTGDKGSDP